VKIILRIVLRIIWKETYENYASLFGVGCRDTWGLAACFLLFKMCHVIKAGALQGDKMKAMTVTGKELPGNSSDLRLNLSAKSVLVSLAQYRQVLVDHPLLLLVHQQLPVSLRPSIQFY